MKTIILALLFLSHLAIAAGQQGGGTQSGGQTGGGGIDIPTGNGEWLRLDTTNDPLTGDLNLGSNQITNLDDPTLAQDAATKAYVDSVVVSPANAILRDGSQPPTADIPWGNFSILDLDDIEFDNGIQAPAVLEHGGNNLIHTTGTISADNGVNVGDIQIDDGVNPPVGIDTTATGLNFNGAKLESLADPVNPQDAATKAYADGIIAGAGLDSVYLRLDATNDPLTGDLDHGSNDGLNFASVEFDDGVNAPYTFRSDPSGRLQISRDNVGQSTWDLVSFAKDGTEVVGFGLFHVGDVNAVDSEGIAIFSLPGAPSTMVIQSFANGTGVLRDIDFYMGGTPVTKLAADGNWDFLSHTLNNVSILEFDSGGAAPFSFLPVAASAFQFVNQSVGQVTQWVYDGSAASNQPNVIDIRATDGTTAYLRQGWFPGLAIIDSAGVDDDVDDLLIRITESAAANSNAGKTLTIQGQNRTAGTGNGGDIFITPGTSVGGLPGAIIIGGNTTFSNLYSLAGVTSLELNNGVNAATMAPAANGMTTTVPFRINFTATTASEPVELNAAGNGVNEFEFLINGSLKWEMPSSGEFRGIDTTDGGLVVVHQTASATPAAGRLRLYPESDDRWKQLNSAGVEQALSIDSLVMLLSGVNAMTGDMNLGLQDLTNALTVELDDGVSSRTLSPTTEGISVGSTQVENVADPDDAQDAATKAYVDAGDSASSAAAILRDGSQPPTADIPWGGFEITGYGTPTAADDVTDKGYVDTQDALDLKIANNLSDLASAATARTNLGVAAATDVMLLNGTQAMTGDMNLGNQDILNVGSIEIDNGTNDAPFRIFEARNSLPAMQTTEAGSSGGMSFFTQDADGTDDIFYRVFGKASGGPTVIGDDHFLTGGWQTSTAMYLLRSNASGTERAKPFLIEVFEDPTVDAAAGNDLTLHAQDRTGGTGAGGDLILAPGTSAGGAKGIISATSSLISNVLNPVAAQDAATKNYVDTSNVQNFIKADGTVAMTGDFNAGTQDIINALTLELDNGANSRTLSPNAEGISVNSTQIESVSDPDDPQDAATKSYVDAATGFTATSSLTTTTITVTEMATFLLDDNTTYLCKARVAGFSTNTANQAVYDVAVAAFRRSAGACTLQGATLEIYSEQSDATWSADFVCDGNNLDLRVGGDTGHTVNWDATIICQKGA